MIDKNVARQEQHALARRVTQVQVPSAARSETPGVSASVKGAFSFASDTSEAENAGFRAAQLRSPVGALRPQTRQRRALASDVASENAGGKVLDNSLHGLL
jgi:hypothetical protein